jgi:hypothetical protein
MINTDIYSLERSDWEKFYKDQFGLEVDFSQTKVPDFLIGQQESKEDWRLLGFPQGFYSIDKAVEQANLLFPCDKYYEYLDEDMRGHTRNARSSYFIWVQNGINPSAYWIGKAPKRDGLNKGLTLLEAIIFQMKYFLETGTHLNPECDTYCNGSRNKQDYIPCIGFKNGVCKIGWVEKESFGEKDGIREVLHF